MCPSYSFLKSGSRIAVFQWFEKNKISANSCKDFSVKLVVKKSRKKMRLSADSGQFLSVAGTVCFFQQTVYKNKEFSWSYYKGMDQSRWIDMRKKTCILLNEGVFFCVYQIDTCSSSYSSLESWSMTFFFFAFLMQNTVIRSLSLLS